METFNIENKHIAVTGASSGIGHHFAGILAAAGAKVTLGARRTDKLSARIEEITSKGGKAFAHKLDVQNQDSMEEFLSAAEEQYGPIDVLVNNAGIEGPKSYLTLEQSEWDQVFDTNLKGAWLMSKLYSQRKIANKMDEGNIIMISSITDRRVIKGQFHYAVSKGAMTRMTEVMALEAARHGIRVNAIAPGYFLTDISRELLDSSFGKEFQKRVPMRRFGEFKELSGPLLLLASDASRYMTGSVITVDGGHVCSSL